MIFFILINKFAFSFPVNEMINDDFLLEVPNPDGYSLLNCPPDWWDKGFVISKPSKRAFLFKQPTKDFGETIKQLKKYDDLFDYHQIRFSYLKNLRDFQHLFASYSENTLKDGEWLPNSINYELSFTPAAALKTTFSNRNNQNNFTDNSFDYLTESRKIKNNFLSFNSQLYDFNSINTFPHYEKIQSNENNNSLLYLCGPLCCLVIIGILLFNIYKKRQRQRQSRVVSTLN